MSFGENLRKLRENKHISQKMLSIRLGISQSSISDWEADRKFPPAKTIVRLADILETTTDFLLDRSSKPENQHTKKAAADPANSLKQEISSLFDTLTPDDQEKVLSYARFVSSSKYTQEQSPSAPRSSRPADE